MDSFIAVEAVYSSMEDDKPLQDAVGRHSDASGYGFGTRDASWYFEDDEGGNQRAALCEQRLRETGLCISVKSTTIG